MTLERSLLLLLYYASYSWVRTQGPQLRGIKNGPACLPGHDAEGGMLTTLYAVALFPEAFYGEKRHMSLRKKGVV